MKKYSRKIIVSIILIFLSSHNSLAKNRIECPFSSLDGESGREYMTNLIGSSIFDSLSPERNEGFEKLDEVMNQVLDKNCQLSDGRSAINFIDAGFSQAYKNVKDKNVILEKLKLLEEQYPDSIYPSLLKSQFWIEFAWDARGNGYASSVSQEGWKLFRERLTKAEKILIENKNKASTSPAWYLLRYIPLFHLDHPQKEKDKFYSEAFKKHKGFLRLYILRRNQLRPRWGGSWAKVDEFINWAAENTKEIEGAGMYARLYFGVYTNLRKNESLYKNTLADWDKLKSGLTDLISLYPESKFHKNIFALMACEASDKSSYHEIRSKISSDERWTWSKKYSVNYCDHVLNYSVK